MTDMRQNLSCAAALLLAGTAVQAAGRPAPIAAGAHYVALGSSFAAGPGVTHSADTPPTRCSRSRDNYAQQLARKRGFRLTDVSCGGATTSHITGPWAELAPQMEALTPRTALVTVTIGGNDIGYIGGLMAASCADGAARDPAAKAVCAAVAARRSSAGPSPGGPEAWTALADGLDKVAGAIRQRAPHARLIFVDYLTVVPRGQGCAGVPLPKAARRTARATANRLARETAAAARRAGAESLKVSALSRHHDACAPVPWMTGFVPETPGQPFVPYHPNLAGMTAVAEALDRHLFPAR